MQVIAIVVYKTIFSFIIMIKNLISCNNPIDYKSFANYTSFVI